MMRTILNVYFYKKKWVLFPFILFILQMISYEELLAQNAPPPKVFSTQYKSWGGYMTTARISKRWSIWNDFHFVRQTFTVFRTGMMYHLTNNATLAGGYGYLILPIMVNDEWLLRSEHRPWMQLQTTNSLTDNIQLTNRIRYDFRNVQKVESEKLSNDYSSYHRIRFLVSFRYKLNQWKIKEGIPYVNLADEVLLNFGKSILYNQFDQNRLSLMLGIQFKKLSVQSGYMYRFIQQSSGNKFIHNHLLVIWVFQTFDLRKKETNQ